MSGRVVSHDRHQFGRIGSCVTSSGFCQYKHTDQVDFWRLKFPGWQKHSMAVRLFPYILDDVWDDEGWSDREALLSILLLLRWLRAVMSANKPVESQVRTSRTIIGVLSCWSYVIYSAKILLDFVKIWEGASMEWTSRTIANAIKTDGACNQSGCIASAGTYIKKVTDATYTAMLKLAAFCSWWIFHAIACWCTVYNLILHNIFFSIFIWVMLAMSM
jgi:hypothetical protein